MKRLTLLLLVLLTACSKPQHDAVDYHHRYHHVQRVHAKERAARRAW